MKQENKTEKYKKNKNYVYICLTHMTDMTDKVH